VKILLLLTNDCMDNFPIGTTCRQKVSLLFSFDLRAASPRRFEFLHVNAAAVAANGAGYKAFYYTSMNSCNVLWAYFVHGWTADYCCACVPPATALHQVKNLAKLAHEFCVLEFDHCGFIIK